MYSLDCSYYKKEFSTVEELIEDVLASGMDPNYDLLKNGKKTGNILADLFLEDAGPGMFIDDQEWEREMGR